MQKQTQLKQGLIVSTAGVLVFILIGSVRADTPGPVIINELMWDGTEYIELYNTGEDSVSLSGWSLTRQKGQTEEERTITTFGGEDVILGESYFLVERKEEATSVPADKVVSKVSDLTLLNTGELVRLKNDGGGVEDGANWFGMWFAGDDAGEGKSMERIGVDLDGTLEESWHTSTGEVGGRTGTPGEANSQPKVNETPEAEISVSGDEFFTGESILFSGEDSSDGDGDALTFTWTFGDGTSASGITATHEYDAAGTFLVTLTADDGELADEATASVTIMRPEYSDNVVVNELLPNPVGSDTTGEFLELFNSGSVAVDLSGWQLDDADGGSKAYVIPAGTNIPAGGYLSWLRSVTKIALNNDGDSARLLDPAGEVKSVFAYTESVSEGEAWAKVESGWKVTTTLTAGSKNIITEPVDDEEESSDEEENGDGDAVEFSKAIEIFAVLPNPEGTDTEDEYIELINTGSSNVSLYKWVLDDEEGGSSAYAFPAGTEIADGETLKFFRSETKIALNNNGDSARLFDPAGELADELIYDESAGEGEVLTSGTGLATSSGQVAGESVKSVELKDIRKEEEGIIVTTKGVVSSLPGVLGKGVLYLAGSGIQIYFSAGEYPDLAIGDTVSVTGELASYLGEARLKLAAATDIEKTAEGEAPVPHRVETGKVGEDLEGTLVVIVGRISQTSGDTFYVDDGSGEVKVFIKETTGIEKPKMKKGDLFTIIGIVSQTQSGYRILPRSQDDIHEGAVAGLTSFPAAGLRREGFGPQGRLESLGMALSALLLPFLVRGASFRT